MFHQYPITDELIDIQHRTFWSGAWECLLMLKEDGRNKSNCSWGFWLIGIERESGHWEWPEIAHQLGKVHHSSLRKHKPPNFQCYSVSSDIAERCKCSHLCSGIAWVPMTTWSCNLFTEFPGSQCCIIHSRTLPYSVSQNSLHYFSGLCTMDSALSSYRWVAETQGVKICHMVGKNQTRDIKSLVSCEVSGLFQHQHEQSSDGHRCMPSGQHALLLPNRRCISFHALRSWACQPDMSTIPISLTHTQPSYPGLIYSLLVLLFLPFRHSPPLRVQYKVRGKQNTVNRRSESQKAGTKKKCHSLVLFRQVSRKDMGQW